MDEDMNMNSYYNPASVVPEETVGQYTAKTFGWMFLGLLVTFAIAITGYRTGAIYYVFSVPYLYYILPIAELIVVIVLSARIQKLSVGMARGLFLLYAVLNGIVFSAYFLIFQMPSLILIFGITALFFGIMALIGHVTHADLSKLRNLLMGGVLVLAAYWILSMFLDLSRYETIICGVGVFIFLLLTAYDTQKIKAYYTVYSQDNVMLKKASIFSALQLYLDFINLFLYLMRILGRRRR